MDKLEKYILFTSLITTFSAIFVSKAFALGAPTIGKEFFMDNVTQNFMLTLGAVFICALTIPTGQFCSKFGCKKIFIIGCLIFIIGLILAPLSISSEMLLFSRVIIGIGYTLFLVAEISMIVLAINKENRGRAFGIMNIGPYIACILAPSLGGYMINNFGWRSIFYLAIILMAICTLLMFLKVDTEWITDAEGKLDVLGSILCFVGVILFSYGFSDLHSLFGQISTLIGVVVLILFVVYESKIEVPAFKIELFKDKLFTAYNMTGFFEFFAICVFDVLFSYYLQYAKGWDPQLTGLFLIVPPIILAVLTPISGKLSDMIHPQKLSTLGLVVLLIPIVLLIFLEVNTPVYLVVIEMALIAVGTALFSVPNTNAVMASIPEEDAPYGSAAQTTLRSFGQTLSLGLLTVVCSFVMGNLPLSVENAALIVSSSRLIAMISLLLCIIAIGFAVWGIRAEKINSI